MGVGDEVQDHLGYPNSSTTSRTHDTLKNLSAHWGGLFGTCTSEER